MTGVAVGVGVGVEVAVGVGVAVAVGVGVGVGVGVSKFFLPLLNLSLLPLCEDNRLIISYQMLIMNQGYSKMNQL